MPILLHRNEIMIWREKDRSRIRAVQMDNLRGLLGIRRIDRMYGLERCALWRKYSPMVWSYRKNGE